MASDKAERRREAWEPAAFVLLLAGLTECSLGWAQLLGLSLSLHALYPATGSFYNPGPYCGFLAMILPVALQYALDGRQRLLHWIGLIYLIAAVAIMPVLMGRTGWIAAVAGCLVVAVGSGRLRWGSRRLMVSLLAAAVAGMIFVVWLKPASALGRLFLWRIGFEAMQGDQLTGVGWAHVAGALGAAQEAYFHDNPFSSFAVVAGSPEYAFNEFLQVGIAFGIPAMLLFAGTIVLTALSAWRGHAYGLTGGLVAFAVVCFGSYPLQFLEFIGAAAVMMVGAVMAVPECRNWVKVAASILIVLVAVEGSLSQWRKRRGDDDWTQERYMIVYHPDEAAICQLDSLAAVHAESAGFLFDYGKTLRESGDYHRSNAILRRGVGVSSDPMFLNLIGRNYQDLGQTDSAEHYYRRAIDRQPKRIYPYYLLAKLYADGAVCRHGDFLKACEQALAMEPKVMSPAIREMRSELLALRDSIEGNGSL